MRVLGLALDRYIYGVGSVHITAEGQHGACMQVTLEEVLHVPGMDSNLLSSNILLGKGLEISMHPTKGTNILLGGKIVSTTVPHGKLLRLKTVSGEEHELRAVGRKPAEPTQPKLLPYDNWHRRFAHLGPWNLRKVEKLVEGIAIDPETLPKERDHYNCEACMSGSQTCNLSDTPMRRPGDLIHSDICGWINPIALSESRYSSTTPRE